MVGTVLMSIVLIQQALVGYLYIFSQGIDYVDYPSSIYIASYTCITYIGFKSRRLNSNQSAKLSQPPPDSNRRCNSKKQAVPLPRRMRKKKSAFYIKLQIDVSACQPVGIIMVTPGSEDTWADVAAPSLRRLVQNRLNQRLPRKSMSPG